MQQPIVFHFDFETRSRVDLTQVGSVVYATHPSTEATLITWAFGNHGPVNHWYLGDPVPQELIHVAENPELYKFNAFNMMFDYLIWTIPFKKVIPTIKPIKIQNLDDTMALTSHYRLGNSLEGAAKMLNLPTSKDKEGRRIMLKQCKPDKHGNFPVLTPEEKEHFIRYGVIDTKILRTVYYSMPELPAPERFAWEWTFKRNLRGIKIDTDLVAALNDIIDRELPKIVNEFNANVFNQVKINSPKCKDFFKPFYPYIENMQSDTVRDMLKDKNPSIPPTVRRALELKDLASSTAISKIKCAINQGYMGRIYGLLAYHYAQTKRWAGRGIQIQNFPRPEESDVQVDKIDFDLNVEDLASFVRQKAPFLKDPIDFAKNLLRRIWVPDEGKSFYCGDWSKVEPTTLYWLLDMGPIPKTWYEEMAAFIYAKPVEDIGKDSEERQIGKAANLGCGYGLGPNKFKDDVYKKTGIEIDEDLAIKAVKAFRSKNHQIVQFWRDLEAGFKMAIAGQPVSLCRGKVHILPMKEKYFKGVKIRLPSGSHLYYHGANVKLERYGNNGGMREVITYRSEERKGVVVDKKLYGGLLTEHVVSATARDIVVPCLWNMEQADFDVLSLVHDEVWAQAEAGRGEEFKNIMCIKPSWCQDMDIGADLKTGVRYLK